MAEDQGPVLPAPQRTALLEAYRAYRETLDPEDAWANSLLASVVTAAVQAGWPQRKTAGALGINRPRLIKLSRVQPAETITVAPYTFGAEFPSEAAAQFRRHEDRVNLRRIRTERRLVAVLRAARAAGWPYRRLGAVLGLTGEGVRKIAEMGIDVAGVRTPAFTPFVRSVKPPPQPAAPSPVLTEAEKEEFGRLAALARNATKHTGRGLGTRPAAEELEELRRSLEARRASEELSEKIIAAKNRGVRWADLDEACGYSPGAARSRAMRHGYGKRPPTMASYTPTPERAYRLAGITPSTGGR